MAERLLSDLVDKILRETYLPKLHEQLYGQVWMRGGYELRLPADDVGVDDIIEGYVNGGNRLWEPLEGSTWGSRPMCAYPGRRAYKPFVDDPQPRYDFECYQCGLPITGDYGTWRDHSGRSLCMLNFVDQELKDVGAYYTDHRPKPARGEEEDDE